MPKWLQTVAQANPLSYAVDAIHALLLTGDYSNISTDITILLGYALGDLTLASITIKRIIE
jgi:ABC-type multidrug transport system permease subunit